MADVESPPTSYAPLPTDENHLGPAPTGGASSKLRLLAVALAVAGLMALSALLGYADRISQGVREGVSSKSSSAADDGGEGVVGSYVAYPWTNKMLLWQRTGFHFQPEKNWMNDPNGPMYYNGWYHFFYQYNPEAAVWGNISWGHAVSKDLVHWEHLPVAMVPDRWYDIGGVWTGSATVLSDGRVIMLYTGITNESVQVQNLAVPADLSDPLLVEWVKHDANPILTPPASVGPEDFRDPTTAWFEPSDDTWRVAIGSKDSANNGVAMVYSTKDFVSYTLLPGFLHAVEHVGMWECVDFYPIATGDSNAKQGLDPSVRPGEKVKHVLKASSSDDHHDWYAIGTYNPAANTWHPIKEALDVGVGLRYDWGNFYASKTFYDEAKRRRVLWGWIGETDSEKADIAKGWASLQGIPRSVLFDKKTPNHLLTWPIDEVESLRMNPRDFSGITIDAGSSLQLDVGAATQLDIEAEFSIDKEALDAVPESDTAYDCSTSTGAAQRGFLGPFGLLVLANHDLTEQTAAYFYVSRGADGHFRTHFCQDETRSSKATDIAKTIVGHTVPVLAGERFSLRVLVDHSIVESFAQGGRASATSRVYPTQAIYSAARVYLFNNATGGRVKAEALRIWQMNATSIHDFHYLDSQAL